METWKGCQRGPGRTGSGVTVVAEHWGSGWSKSPINTHGTKQCDQAQSIIPTSWPQCQFWRAMQIGCTLSSLLLCDGKAPWQGGVGCWHISSAEKQQWKPMQGIISGTKCPLCTKTVPLFLSLNAAELFRSKKFLWKCRRTYWLSKLNANKTGIMSRYLCNGAIMLLFIALTVITVSPDMTATHPLMIYPKKGFISIRKIPQMLVVS